MGIESLQTDGDLMDQDIFANHGLRGTPICLSPVSPPGLKLAILTTVLTAEQTRHH